ncbi:hypothetical protein JK358_15600 [Nocardia sp. 2]|uniref:Uncharacterized protein n=1 Tax=Nocardia acididurans TaxID=2802282 RepID=A0ABS1M6P0_9NOCA|nr:hypothetical protein [Nocardia acididurans]MBL1075820.1 hypothetical protein [Nocardia acididurans]
MSASEDRCWLTEIVSGWEVVRVIGHERGVIASEVQEILNYFGKCPICRHPARAWHITAEFDDNRVESQDVAECGGWCGWKGPVRPVAMTHGALVLTKERKEIRATTPGLPSA